jgi:alpha-glucosidase
MVAGPMDYTPGAMINAQKENFTEIWNRPMSMGTRCHQLAMYAIYESPLQMLCDSPSNYLKEQECTSFISEFPTVWDETKVLAASISNYIALARKSGDNWYIGAMTNSESRELELDFSFLDEGEYTIEIFQDGINADRYASDYTKTIRKVSYKDIITINMAPGGGWAARIYK